MQKFTLILVVLSLSIALQAQTSKELIEEAMKYKSRENYTETAKLLAQARVLEPENTSLLQELAFAQYKKRAFFEAIPIYETLLVQEPENVDILTRLAEMNSMSPQKKAVEYADRAIQLNPQGTETNMLLARTFLEVEHYPKAIKLYLRAEKEAPDHKDIPCKLAKCYSELGDHRNAVKYYLRSIELDPENASKLYEAAIGCFNANNFSKSIELYEVAGEKGYSKSKIFYYNWGASYEANKDFENALKYYSLSKEYSPYDRELNMTIADIYSNMGKFDKSRDVLNELLEINQDDAEVIYNKGMTYYKSGNITKAESYFNKAFELDPSLKSLRYVKSGF